MRQQSQQIVDTKHMGHASIRKEIIWVNRYDLYVEDYKISEVDACAQFQKDVHEEMHY